MGRLLPGGYDQGARQIQALSCRPGSMLPYWNYFEQEEFVPRWGKVVFKYFSSRVMQRILLDMCGVMDGTDQGETAAEFCDYFCAINRLSAEQAQTKATADE